jgi:hypothetical protein
MMVLRVQYDAYNRQFKLLDRDLAHRLADGETYLLIVDIPIDEAGYAAAEEIPVEVEVVAR